jgi:hypothetical protein
MGGFDLIRVLTIGLSSAALLASCTGTLSEQEQRDVLGALPSDGSARIEDYVLVACKLPGSIRQLGARAVYVSPRRVEMLTQRECGIRGGEFVLFDRSDYSAALSELLPQARAGNPVAQAYVGEIYEKGLGMPSPNPSEAAGWYRKAAQQGNIAAQVALGSLYERGLGVPKDKAEALNWYRSASGIVDDRLEFESAFKAEREQLRREIAKRQSIISQLKSQRSSSADKQLVAQARDARSRAEQLRRQAQAAQTQRQQIQTGAEGAGQQSQLLEKVQRLEKLELAYREDSDLLFEAARFASAE